MLDLIDVRFFKNDVIRNGCSSNHIFINHKLNNCFFLLFGWQDKTKITLFFLHIQIIYSDVFLTFISDLQRIFSELTLKWNTYKTLFLNRLILFVLFLKHFFGGLKSFTFPNYSALAINIKICMFHWTTASPPPPSPACRWIISI